MAPLIEWRLWRQLKGAFKIKRFIFTPVMDSMRGYPVEQYDTMEESLAAAGDAARVFLEPKGHNGMRDIPDGDILLILGDTGRDNMHHAKSEETYRIRTPSRTVLFGTEAVAIALAVRYGQ